jgi:hypothetical protein
MIVTRQDCRKFDREIELRQGCSFQKRAFGRSSGGYGNGPYRNYNADCQPIKRTGTIVLDHLGGCDVTVPEYLVIVPGFRWHMDNQVSNSYWDYPEK